MVRCSGGMLEQTSMAWHSCELVHAGPQAFMDLLLSPSAWQEDAVLGKLRDAWKR